MSLYLRTVSKGRPVKREDIKQLWKQGLITGLFNLQNGMLLFIDYWDCLMILIIYIEELFNACSDYCIESDQNEFYFKSDYKALNDNNSKLKSELQVLQDALNKSNNESEKKSKKIQSLEEQKQSLQTKIKHINKENQDLIAKNKRISIQLESLTAEINQNSSEKIEELKSKLEASEKAKAKCMETIKELEDRLKIKDEDIIDLKENLVELKNDLKEERKELKKMMLEMKEHKVFIN